MNQFSYDKLLVQCILQKVSSVTNMGQNWSYFCPTQKKSRN